jgi:chemotaxis protein histidine kinase CheA
MALPEQIRKQSEAVQELYKQLNASAEASSGEQTPAEEPPAEDVEATAEASSADENTETKNAAPSPAVEQKAGDEKVPEETVLQKYKTLQGMYNAEVPRLHAQNKELNQRVQQMEQLLASLSAQQAAAPQTLAQVEKLVTDKDVEEYGESLDVMRKVSREELGSVASRIAQLENMLKQIQTTVVPQVQNVAHKQAVSAEQSFWADLTKAVPNWREVNDNQDFQTWLLDVDPLTGISRQTYLEDAQRSLDANRVSNFFRTWLEISGQATVAQNNGRAAVSSELEKQVTPGRSRNSGAPAGNKAKVYTPSDITKFFNDVRSGKYRGREQERDRIERDIFAAQRENRIQLNA